MSAIYAHRSAKEAKKANNIGRLNALLSFRQHYLELMRHQESLAKVLENSDSGMQVIREKSADLDMKLREIGAELEQYHSKIVKNEI